MSQKVEISGIQQGGNVILSWTMPARNALQGNTLNINRVDIYRLAEPLTSPLTLSEEEFASRSTLIGTLPVSEDDFARNRLNYVDPLKFAGQPARLRYAVRFVNAQGQKAAFSNFLLIEPAARIAESPANLSGQVTQEAILLSWQAPEKNVDESRPANILGYNLYRKSGEKDTVRLLNKTPVTNTDFADRFFEFEQGYQYFVRTVSLGTGGEPVESLESNILEITPKDIFPPSAPAAITIAAAPNNLSIFFAANPETDVVGYNVYRTTDPNITRQQWQLLTPELLKTNTFQDTSVRSGETYYYYLTAVDKFGNVSLPSETVSETAP
ncbi:MAG TPA: hypothetical protein VK892_01305 [Pyrinomonadaceae bacterium]|nr:hypothetical protein [Pyrinomonadaceae bacterium]